MLELLSPHFIWWSSASSPPLLLIRHGSPLSLPPPSLPSVIPAPSLPPLQSTFYSPLSLFLLTLLLFLSDPFVLSYFTISGIRTLPPSPLLSTYPLFPTPITSHSCPRPKKRRRGDPQSFPPTSTMNGLLSVQHLGWIQSEWVGCGGGGAVREDGGCWTPSQVGQSKVGGGLKDPWALAKFSLSFTVSPNRLKQRQKVRSLHALHHTPMSSLPPFVFSPPFVFRSSCCNSADHQQLLFQTYLTLPNPRLSLHPDIANAPQPLAASHPDPTKPKLAPLASLVTCSQLTPFQIQALPSRVPVLSWSLLLLFATIWLMTPQDKSGKEKARKWVHRERKKGVFVYKRVKIERSTKTSLMQQNEMRRRSGHRSAPILWLQCQKLTSNWHPA